MNTVQFNENNLTLNEGTVRVYDCHSITHEYVGYSDEFLATGIGLPANSHLDMPPEAKKGFAVCRLDDQWQYVADLRGQKAYIKETAAEIEVKELGDLSDELTFIKPETDYDYWDGQGWRTNSKKLKAYQIELVKSEKQNRLEQAEKQLSVLQRAIKFAMTTEDESKLAEQLEIYSVLISRVDSQNASDIDWPEMPKL